ncbi:MAG: alpha-ketoglutarate-dependent dioxygenase AlkB [Crocinitomicaceae bacterium]|nr:alpha-ketoglutarate-dependent dioxygenase AlkB [Crocinitomicaceae bacterium]
MFSEYENLEPIRVVATDGFADYYPNFLAPAARAALLQQLLRLDSFQQNEIVLFGKKIKVPRLEAYYALNGEQYGYSGQQLQAEKFPTFLEELRLEVQERTGYKYNALLINYYRDGQDSNGWHADNEKTLGLNPSIASISLGAERSFELKHLSTGQKKSVLLADGSLLHMHGPLQHHYKHQLPKKRALTEARLNLTFRWIQPSV